MGCGGIGQDNNRLGGTSTIVWQTDVVGCMCKMNVGGRNIYILIIYTYHIYLSICEYS